uniref:Uncharacterized protein n=1 Tax=Steinernema glaseri TaxID=37863 RepID=A0A1I7ZQ60_9BILA
MINDVLKHISKGNTEGRGQPKKRNAKGAYEDMSATPIGEEFGRGPYLEKEKGQGSQSQKRCGAKTRKECVKSLSEGGTEQIDWSEIAYTLDPQSSPSRRRSIRYRQRRQFGVTKTDNNTRGNNAEHNWLPRRMNAIAVGRRRPKGDHTSRAVIIAGGNGNMRLRTKSNEYLWGKTSFLLSGLTSSVGRPDRY